MRLLSEWLLRTLVLFVTAYIVPGFEIKSFFTAIVVALVLGILNLFVKPILILLTLPLTVLTLGLFTFVINALLLLVTSQLVRDFHIESFMTAIAASIVITIVSTLINLIFRS